MKETYFEWAIQIAESWDELCDMINRSLTAMNNLLHSLDLAISPHITGNYIAEKVVPNSVFSLISSYSTRISNLAMELMQFIDKFRDSHLKNIEYIVKWCDEEYTSINLYNINKNVNANIIRVQALYTTNQLCLIIKSQHKIVSDILNSAINKVDLYILYKSTKNFGVSQTHIEHFQQLRNFKCNNAFKERQFLTSYYTK
ncbi:hypothetical protein ACR3K2_15280 [Cryptosporidium serpentis]